MKPNRIIRKRIRQKLWPYFRRPLTPLCMTPTFLIIGAQKSGTTSMIRLLTQHPDILPPSFLEEVHYFDMQYQRGDAWYLTHFPLRRKGKITCEKSPYYLYHPLVAERVAKYDKNIRLIVVLRDPVQRAYSHYQMMKRRGWESRPFRVAAEEEMKRVESEHARLAKGEINFSIVHQRFSYVARGRYVEQLDVWTKIFPRKQIYITTSERFARETHAVSLEIFDFLGLRPFVMKETKRYNTHRYDPLSSSDAKWLADYFHPFNLRLAERYGINIYEWTSFQSSV